MKSFFIQEPGASFVRTVPEPRLSPGEILLRIRMVGFCGTDLSTFRGKNPLVSYPRIPGHETSATIIELGPDVPRQYNAGQNVDRFALQQLRHLCPAQAGRTNACLPSRKLGVPQDGAMSEFFKVPWHEGHDAEGLSRCRSSA